MKNHYEVEHFNIFWMYVNEIIRLCFGMKNSKKDERINIL